MIDELSVPFCRGAGLLILTSFPADLTAAARCAEQGRDQSIAGSWTRQNGKRTRG